MNILTRELLGAAAGPHLLIMGGIHGDEFEPMAAVRRLMTAIDVAHLRGRVTLAPVINEPAFERGARTAEDGLDLARTFPGRADGTVTGRIAHAATQLIRSADYLIDLHTGGTICRIKPLVGYMLVEDARVLDEQRRMARAFNLPIVWGTSAKLDGRSLSAARDARVPAIYAEYHGGGMCDPQGVSDYVEGCLNVMAELGMIYCPQTLPPLRPRGIEWFVEDPRDQSGHLQLCHPAPVAGFFEPEVELGQRVEAGQRLGRVVDVLGERPTDVLSAQAGEVIVLHTFARVSQGTGLVVVLDTGLARPLS